MHCILLFLSCLSFQQADTASAWPYQHVDKKSMLSNSAITSVYKDKYDYIWLGTWDGLNRYDGSVMKVYKPDPFVKGSLSNNVVRNFLEDGEGSLWVITHLGINKYNRDSDSFQAYLDNMQGVAFQEYNIRACIGDQSMIWLSQMGKGISRYAKDKDTFIPVHFDGLDQNWLNGVLDLGHNKNLLYMLGSDGQMVCTLNQQIVYTKKIPDVKKMVYHQFMQLGGYYYLVIALNTGQLIMYNLNAIESNPQSLTLGKVTVTSLNESEDHSSIWVGTESGSIFKIIPGAQTLHAKLMNAYFPTFSNNGTKVLSIYEANQNLIWIGTDGDGVYKFLTRPKMFNSLQAGNTNAGQLSHSIIRSVYEDPSGKLYIGTRGGGLNIIDQGGKYTQVINTSNGLSNNTVLSMNRDQQGNLWIGHDGEGIDMIEAQTNRILHFPDDFDTESNTTFSSVYSICIDAFNDVWLGTSGSGVIHWKVSRGKSGKYHLNESEQIIHSTGSQLPSIGSNIVYAIIEEKPNILWIGTRGTGIYRYNALTRQLEEHIQTNSSGPNRLSNDDVLSLAIDKQEQLWVGTSGGLNRILLQRKPYTVNHFTMHEGLPNNTIHGILEDRNSNLWISTNHGLVMYDRKKNAFNHYDSNDGLQNNEFADGAVYASRISEKLYFGGIDGLDIVYPSKVNTLRHFPRLAISEFLVHNVPVIPGDESGILSNHIDDTKRIVLNYDQNFISFAFTTLDYWQKQKSEFSYFLENFDKNWNHIGQQQSIALTNIPPGKYILNINYTNENGEWSAAPRTLEITVLPPFWRTPWAYLLYLMLAIGLQVAIIFYIRLKSKAKKALAMDKFKTRQLKELNDYKLQFFTNIAHEFRTPLTLILGPVSSLLNKISDVDAQKQLKTIHSNSVRLQKLIEELIQFRKLESGKETLEISSADLIPFTQQITETFQAYAHERDIHLEFHPAVETMPALFDSRKVEKILINLISNAIKYSFVGGKVTLALAEEKGEAKFTLRDEGCGIAEEYRHSIFESFYQSPVQLTDSNGLAKSTGIGLSLTRSLVIIHHGNIRVESKLGKGSTFFVTLPISKVHYPNMVDSISPLLPAPNLKEKISLEFQIDHYHEGAEAENQSIESNGKRFSLLVVDDNPQITSLLENILSDKYTIHKANQGHGALRMLEEERIDLVISDILMPDMDGLTLCKSIKENIQTSHIPVILLTAKAEIENRIEGLQVGADSYIPKPFHPEHLFVRIEKLIERMELIRGKFANIANTELGQLSPGISDRDDVFFSKITQCILNHLSEPEFNADNIGDEVGMSKASLYRKVKTITGLTPHGLIKQYRLKKAADLLRGTSLSVSEVIFETGFNSRSYFYKSFNEMFHCHPKDFNASTPLTEPS